MQNVFTRIVRKKEDSLFYKHGILNEAGRLTTEGRQDFIDLLFLGKTPEEARELILKEVLSIDKEK